MILTGPLILFSIRLVIYLLKSDTKVIERYHRLNYLLNGKDIDQDHFVFSILKLGLDGQLINPKKINTAYYDLSSELSLERRNAYAEIDVTELKASRAYLIDRWKYLAYRN